MTDKSESEIEYRHEPARFEKGTEFSRRLFGLVGFRSARDERQGNYPSLGERVRERIRQIFDD
jgi:hypothetical protein